MSGVTGNNKIQSREDFKEILKEAKELISAFPGFISIEPTGSYNSDQTKTTFGDMDLITVIDGALYNNDKKLIKAELAKYMLTQAVVVPFISEKYLGKRYYNSGEIITISYRGIDSYLEACQVDFMIAMDETEAEFKMNFLDLPAAKQGLVLGLVKTILIERKPLEVLHDLDINCPLGLEDNQEFEFNLSSVELQLRKVTYEDGSFKQKDREIMWKSNSWGAIEVLLKDYDLSSSFGGLLKQTKDILKNKRSSNRMAGVFKSMISIKSGEVGTEKGANKQIALDLVQKTFGENNDKD